MVVILTDKLDNGQSNLQDREDLQKSAEASSASGQQAITREQLSLRKQLLQWRTLLPLAIVIVGLLVFIFKTNLNLQQTWLAIQHANFWLFLLAFVIYYCSFGLRAWRWRILLQNANKEYRSQKKLPSLWRLTEIIYISFFANALVPAKLGDLYRAYLLQQDTGIPTTRSVGVVVAERLLDLCVLLLLFIGAIFISLHDRMPPQIIVSLNIVVIVVFLGIACLCVMHLGHMHITRLIPERFREHYAHFQAGTVGSLRRLHILVSLTASIWLCEALRFFCIALALQLINGSLLYMLAIAVFIGLGEALLTAIPATGGGVGLVEGGMVAMITLFYHGADALSLAAAAIFLDRIITLFSIIVIGLLVFLLAFRRKLVGSAASKSVVLVSRRPLQIP